MAVARSLKNAPITEAVVNLHARFSSQPSAETFARFVDQVKSEYPHQEQRQQVAFRMTAGQPLEQSPPQFSGNLLRSEDGTQVVQSTPQGLAFSRLKPYQNWEMLISETWRLWKIYRETFQPERVARLSTRFINRLEFPDLALDFDHYLTIGPRLPEDLPQTLSSFSTSINIPNVAQGTFAIIRAVFDVAAVKQTVPVFLDIDVVRECDISPSDDESLRRALDDLRSIKNRAFFGSLTDKAVEVFA